MVCVQRLPEGPVEVVRLDLVIAASWMPQKRSPFTW